MNTEQTWAVLAHVNDDGTGYLDTGAERHEVCEPTTHETMIALVALAKNLASEQGANVLLGGTAPSAPRVGLLITAEGHVSEDPRGLLHRAPRPPMPHAPRKRRQPGRSTPTVPRTTPPTPSSTTHEAASNEVEAAPRTEPAEESEVSDSTQLSIFDDVDHVLPTPATRDAKSPFPWRTVAGVLAASACLAGTAFATVGRDTPPAPSRMSEDKPLPTVVATETTATAPVDVRVRTSVGERGNVVLTVRSDVPTVTLTLRTNDGRRHRRTVTLSDGSGSTRLRLTPGLWTYRITATGAQPAQGRLVIRRPKPATDQSTPVPQPAPGPVAPPPPAPAPPGPRPPDPPPKAPPKAPQDPHDSPPPSPIG